MPLFQNRTPLGQGYGFNNRGAALTVMLIGGGGRWMLGHGGLISKPWTPLEANVAQQGVHVVK